MARDDDLYILAEVMAEASGFPACQASNEQPQAHWAETCLYEVMRLKSFTLSRMEQLEAVVIAHMGDRLSQKQLELDNAKSTPYGPACTIQQQLTSMRAEVEFLHTQLLVQKDKHATDIAALRHEVDRKFTDKMLKELVAEKSQELVTVIEAAHEVVRESTDDIRMVHQASATSTATVMSKDPDTPHRKQVLRLEEMAREIADLKEASEKKQSLPSLLNIVPRIEEVELEIARLTSRQEALEVKVMEWDVIELRKRLEETESHVIIAETQMPKKWAGFEYFFGLESSSQDIYYQCPS